MTSARVVKRLGALRSMRTLKNLQPRNGLAPPVAASGSLAHPPNPDAAQDLSASL